MKAERGRRVIGVISDTHGLLRPEAEAALAGVELILHAGDVGKPEVLERLAQIAPVKAVRGNNDRDAWSAGIPETLSIDAAGVRIFMIHDLKELAFDPAAEGFNIVIAGHSHKPRIEERGEVLYLNPGSAGPRRFKLPVTLARLAVSAGKASVELMELVRR